jgi:membrane protease YdiL (CAAX protease family)
MNFRVLVARLRAEEPAPPWSLARAVQLLASYVLLYVIAAPLAVTVLAGPEAAQTFNPVIANLSSLLASGALLALIIPALWQDVRRGSPIHTLRLDRSGPTPVWAIVLISLGTAITIDLIPILAQVFSLPPNLLGLWWQDAASLALVVITIPVVLPLTETILLQGMLYPALAARVGNLRAIALTGLAFAVLQALPDPSDPVLWITALLSGLYLTGVRAFEQSTRAALAARLMFAVFLLIKALVLLG